MCIMRKQHTSIQHAGHRRMGPVATGCLDCSLDPRQQRTRRSSVLQTTNIQQLANITTTPRYSASFHLSGQSFAQSEHYLYSQASRSKLSWVSTHPQIFIIITAAFMYQDVITVILNNKGVMQTLRLNVCKPICLHHCLLLKYKNNK